MTRLILTADSSTAGALVGARADNLAIAIERRLVWGALPSEVQLEAFFAARTTQENGLHWQDDTPSWRLKEFGVTDLGLIELCSKCESVELWIGPEPNAQLMLLWLLNYWRARTTATPMLVLRQADAAVGGTEPEQLAKLDLPAVEITGDHLELASLAWRAYRAPTPQAWFNLLNADLSPLPRLRSCVLALLEELPNQATGLGATEARILELISSGDALPYDVFPGHEKPNKRRVFHYWEIGLLLDGLARCPVPAVSGLDEGPFSLEMHRDQTRHERYKRSRLSLTDLGKAVLAGREDFRRYNPIRRWWGGTEVTNQRLWRWNSDSRTLVAP